MSYRLLDDNLIQEIVSLDMEEQGGWLYLVPHEEFSGAWYVDSLDPAFLFDFEDLIGSYRVLWPSDLGEFKRRCEVLGYQFAFVEDPGQILKGYEGLQDRPPVTIQSTLEGTTNGFLPWQVRGFNKLIRPTDLKGGLCFWDTGTGKTVFVASGILWHTVVRNDAELVFVVVKSNNKRDMQRKLKKLAGIDSRILDGKTTKRATTYLDISQTPGTQVLITNYEKFREDREFLEALVTGRKVLIFWDEMPTRLSHRGNQLYNAVRDVLYEPPENKFYYGSISWDRKRPSWLRQYELTATPIEKDPGDQFSCIRLIDPDILGTVTQFETEHVMTRNPISRKPQKWHRLDRMSHKLEHMMHRVDKLDPEVAKYFPELIEDTVYIDWGPTRKSYDALQKQARLMVEEGEDVTILSLIAVMQMICDMPAMVTSSASNREAFEALLAEADNEDGEPSRSIKTGSEMALRLITSLKKPLDNTGHTKLDRLKDDLLIKHPDEKVLLFSTWGDYIFPFYEEKLKEWGVTYELYRGTDKQRQLAKDNWRNDPGIRVLVCSDAGSDSIDLPEASVVINYNLPFLYSRKYQRIHRASRADSTHDTLYVLNYVMANSVEERRLELIEERFGYQQEVLGTATKVAASAGLSREDLFYMLFAD
jgi:SNF2 family DNA or RNA helicase